MRDGYCVQDSGGLGPSEKAGMASDCVPRKEEASRAGLGQGLSESRRSVMPQGETMEGGKSQG